MFFFSKDEKESLTRLLSCVQAIHGDLAKHYGTLGFKGAINVKLWESHKAWASYEAAVGEAEEQCKP